MTIHRSTIIVVIVIVAAVALVALAYSQQQQAANQANVAATAQAVAESRRATALANADIAATAQAVARSNEATALAKADIAATVQAIAVANQATAIADADIAATAQAVAESNEATAVADADIAATAQAVAESNEATAVAESESSRATATLGAEIMATIYSQVDAERAAAVANYEALAAASTQTILDVVATAVASGGLSDSNGGGVRLPKSIDMKNNATGFSATVRYPADWFARLNAGMVIVGSDEAMLSGVDVMPENAGLVTIVFITPVMAESMSLAADADSMDVIDLFVQTIGGEVEISGPTEITVNDVRMAQGIIKDKDGDGAMLAYKMGDVFVMAICVASPGKLGDYEDTFEAIAASVTLTE